MNNHCKPRGCYKYRVFLLAAIFAAALSLSVLMVIGSQTNALAQSQDQSKASGQKGQFFADLTGQGVTPPRTTSATGKATFTVTDGANKMSYSIKADKINRVSDVFVSASTGGRYNDLVPLRSSVKEGITGPIKGTVFASGTISPSDFTGLLKGKQMSDLIKMILDGKVYVRVQTTNAPLGEIQGKVQPAVS
jgi:CHRD domain